MPTVAFEIDYTPRRQRRSMPKAALPERGRIGSGVALTTTANKVRRVDNPTHWQTLILLLPLLHNADSNNYRKPISGASIQRTIDEMQAMFSGYTLVRAMGWYWDEIKNTGVPDDLVRLEVDGVFTGDDLRALHEWKRTLRRRFRQEYIYMKLVASGVAV